MSAELDIARQWVAKARNDLLNADNNLASEQVPTDTVCFHCQQVAEKLLKAVLTVQGVPPPRTHVLMMLADQIAYWFPTVAQLDHELAILTPYAVAARYPEDYFNMPTIDIEARRYARTVTKGATMGTNERLKKLIEEPPDLLARVDELLSGGTHEPAVPTTDRRLFTITDMARELNVSRMTVHRMLADGRLPFIETRAGRWRMRRPVRLLIHKSGGQVSERNRHSPMIFTSTRLRRRPSNSP